MTRMAHRVPVSARVFWITTVVVGVLEAMWFVRVSTGSIEPVGIPIYLMLVSPALLAVACAVGFMVAVLCGLVFVLLLRKPAAISDDLTIHNATAKLVFSLILAGCVSTTVTLVMVNYTPSLATVGGPLAVWWSVWVIAFIILRRLILGIFNRRRRDQCPAAGSERYTAGNAQRK